MHGGVRRGVVQNSGVSLCFVTGCPLGSPLVLFYT